MKAKMRQLMLGGSILGLTMAVVPAGSAAFAQTAAKPTASRVAVAALEDEEATVPVSVGADGAPEIVVTGPSIRGVAPIGSNLVSVGTESLAATGSQTVTGALESVPALSGTTGQGNTSAFYQPSIHQLGASASNSTLVLIDGHRGPTGGTNHTFLDPNIIPQNMLQRVEVLAEGASSVYGSDAVAGVINFITRKRYEGIQANGSVVLRDGTFGHTVGLLAGQNWDRGSAVFGATWSYQDNLSSGDRAFTHPDHRAQGGGNFMNFSCSPPSIQPAGQGTIYPSPTATAAVANNQQNFSCTNWGVTDLIGSEERHNVMGKFTFDATDSLTLGLDLLYARRRNETIQGAGTVQATVFATGGQANPFYVNPPGVAANSQTIRWDATELLGPAKGKSDSDSMFMNFTAGYEISGDWNFDFLASAGRDESSTYSEGTINTSAALLALNGTTNGGGNLAAVSIPGTNIIVSQLPLTTANALDVWSAPGSNKTSREVLDRLLDNTNLLRNTSGYQQVRGSISGSLFELPAGPVKVAFGAELLKTQLSQFVSRANNSGPTRNGSQQLRFKFDRTVHSGFFELNVPLVSPDMDVSFIRRFDLSLAGRYDHYDDFGETTNPKVGFNWDVVDGFRFRGNWSTSFVAPPLTILGDEFGAFGTAGWNTQTNNINVPVSAYPAITSIIPSCAGQELCNIGSLQGIQVTSGDPRAGAQEGDGWSLGFDTAPQLVRGLRVSGTYWRTSFTGGVTGPQISNVINTASAQSLLTFYPGCATQDQIAAVTRGIPQTNSQAACTSYIFRTLNSNWLNLRIAGIDYSVDYDLETDTAGTFSAGLSGTEFLKFRQSFGSGPEYSVLNTAGNNGTFPSIRTKFRSYLGWRDGPFSARVFANYVGSFRNWSSNTVTPLTRDANGNPSGGGDKVKAQTTFDLNMVYDFEGSFLNGSQLSIAARNLFDKDPPFYNGSTGYYSLVHNPFGRTVTVSLTMKLF